MVKPVKRRPLSLHYPPRDLSCERDNTRMFSFSHPSSLNSKTFLGNPILADACVRRGYFQEALYLTAHAARLATNFPHVHAANGADMRALGQLLALLDHRQAPLLRCQLFTADTSVSRTGARPRMSYGRL